MSTISMEMDYSLSLRIASIFIMFSVSLLGMVIPYIYAAARRGGVDTPENRKKIMDSDGLRIVRTFAAGILLGVGFIHLLNDGVNKLAEVSLDYPALGFTLATVGVIIVLGFEQIALMLIGCINTEEKLSTSDKFGCTSAQQELEVVEANRAKDATCEHSHASHSVNVLTGTHSLSGIVKAYMMEISVAIHSIIIGIALGSMAGEESVGELVPLLVAICFHQFFEGIGLGSVVESARVELGRAKIIIFSLTFALTVPIGVVVGILITTDQALEEGPTETQTYTTGCLNSLAGGIMIYVALVEMIAEDFQQAAIANNIGLKVKMFTALSIGTLSMAIIALWA